MLKTYIVKVHGFEYQTQAVSSCEAIMFAIARYGNCTVTARRAQA